MKILNLKDESIIDIQIDKEYYPYVDLYVTHFIIELSSKDIEVIVRDKDGFIFDESYIMKLFINNLDHIRNLKESEFFEWLENKLNKNFKDFYIDYC